MAKDTGHGATIAFGTTTISGCVRSAQMPSFEMEAVDATCLSSQDYMELVPADVSNPGRCVITFAFDPEDVLPARGTVEDITITLAISNPANTVPATLVGSGFIAVVGLPNLVNNELIEMTVEFQFDGIGTPPTWTPEAAS